MDHALFWEQERCRQCFVAGIGNADENRNQGGKEGSSPCSCKERTDPISGEKTESRTGDRENSPRLRVLQPFLNSVLARVVEEMLGRQGRDRGFAWRQGGADAESTSGPRITIDRRRKLTGNDLGQLDRLVPDSLEPLTGDGPADESEFLGLGGAKGPRREGEFVQERSVGGDAREALQRSDIGCESDVDFLSGEAESGE